MTRFSLAALVGLVAMLGACGNTAEVRYKVTVEVDDMGTHRSGTSVWSFKLSEPTVALASPYDAEFKGEAVAVDLGNRQVLFALLKDENGGLGTVQLWPEHLFKDLTSGSERIATSGKPLRTKGFPESFRAFARRFRILASHL
jgi:hypothetical protein